jgi:Outer membrane protein beta-barrel domain
MSRLCTRAAALGLAMVVGALPANAQRSKPRSSSFIHSLVWSAGAGASMPTGDLADGAATGFHVQGGSAFRPSGWPISLRGELAYHHFGAKDYTLPGGRGGAPIAYTGKSSSIHGGLDASYAFASGRRMKPYLLGGPGVYNNRSEVTRAGSTPTTASETKVGLNVGGGMNFPIVGHNAFLEARYHHVDQAAWVPITFGFRF